MNKHDRDTWLDAVYDMHRRILDEENALYQRAIRAHAGEPLVDIEAAKRRRETVIAAANRARMATVAAIRAEYNGTKSTEEK